MSDTAFKSAKYPAYTKRDLEGFIKNGHDLTGAMAAEVARRNRRDAGDVSVMTDGERLRFAAAQDDGLGRPWVKGDPAFVERVYRRVLSTTRTDDNAAYRRDMIDAGRGHLLR